MKQPAPELQPVLQNTISLWRRLDKTGWTEVRRYRRYAVYLPDDWEDQQDRPAISQVTCPGCGKRMARQYLNLQHECTEGVTQPDYTPAYIKRREEKAAEWKTRKDHYTRAAPSGITIRETANEYVVDYSQVPNLKPTGQEGLVRTVPKTVLRSNSAPRTGTNRTQ